MNLMEFKKKLLVESHELVSQKRNSLIQELKNLLDSLDNETKSSMGDKYETSREMMMQERAKLEDQKMLYEKHLSFLEAIDINKEYKKVEFGSLVMAEETSYLICSAIGLIKLEGNQAFVISSNSPLAQQMLGKTTGDKVLFNKNSFTIQGVA